MTGNRSLSFCVSAALVFGLGLAHAQPAGPSVRASLTLPDAPEPAQAGGDAAGTATISGRVTDMSGAPLEGASVKLTSAVMPERTLVSDEQGYFTFRYLVPGTYSLVVSLTGLQSYQNANVVLGANQALTLHPIPLAVTGTSSVVHVTATPTEVADAQIDEQVHQRLLGVIPNFYTSYIWDAAPLDRSQKFRLAAHSVLDPVTFLTTGLAAAGQQYVNAYGQYGSGFQGYAKRYGADYADLTISRMLSSAILPSLFHEDPRYFYKGAGTIRQRTLYAVERSVITRDDHRHDHFGYSRVLGYFGAGAISNAYHPSNDRGVGLTLSNSAIAIGGSAIDNLFREFLWRKLTKNVPAGENGEASAPTTVPASAPKH